MTTPTHNSGEAGALKKNILIKVFGVGGGGCNAVNHMANDVFENLTFALVNTDAQAMAKSTVTEQLVLATSLTRGLGTGGDPELGKSAAEADIEKLRQLCSGADIVFIVAGLGGGTGTGASPVIAQVARACGALVLGIVTLPFDFEGARRQRQAQAGLQALKAAGDAVICLPNQRVFKLIDEKTSFIETFNISNELLAQGVRGIWRLLSQTGLINVDFNDLCSVTKGRHSESLFAAVEAAGENRAQQAIEGLLAHPLLEGGQVLSEADTVLVSLVGGRDLTMSEINRVMEQINRQCEGAHLIMGAAVDDAFSHRLAVMLVAGRHTEIAARSTPLNPEKLEAGKAAGSSNGMDTDLSRTGSMGRPASRFVAPAPELTDERKEQLLTKQGGPRSRKKTIPMRQAQLPLEIVSKGRFEKSEPTIHHGEDIDVPTYIRRGVALN